MKENKTASQYYTLSLPQSQLHSAFAGMEKCESGGTHGIGSCRCSQRKCCNIMHQYASICYNAEVSLELQTLILVGGHSA